MKNYRILTILAAALFLAVLPAHRACGEHGLYRGTTDSDYGPGSSISSDKGLWPATWPRELEAFRTRARTFHPLTQIQEAVHEIRFTNRADFERVWPVLLKLKAPGAPLTLYLTDSPPPGRMGVWFTKGVPVVRIYAPDQSCVWTSGVIPTEPEEQLLKEGTRLLKSGPPWPAEIVGTSGALPEWVRAIRGADGKLRWTAADFAADMKELKDCAVPHPLAVDGCVHRARIDLDLVADGKVIDLAKLHLPPETVTHDERIKIPKPSAGHVKPMREQESVNLMPVQEASAIVRVKMLALKDDVLEYEVIRVIYGHADGKVLHVRSHMNDQDVRNWLRQGARESKKEVREPSAEEVRAEAVRQNYFKVGREVIVFLMGGPQGTNPAVWLSLAGCYDSPHFPLDNFEKAIVDVIKTGTHLRPDITPPREGMCRLLPCIRSSERVVRARLVKVGETSAQWQVSGLLYVAPPPRQRPGSAPAGNGPAEAVQPEKPATISVELATWRARAETIVRYRVAQQPGTAVKEEDIQVEFTRLLKDELTPERGAILFIRPREKPGDGAVYMLLGIAYGDPDKANSLDQHEKAIRKVIAKIAKGEYDTGIVDE